jgi:protein-S-isoprenylcysteine O-methyltransferase Ste14
MSPDSAIRILWLIFIGYWALSAAGVKKDVHRVYRSGGFVVVRIFILIAVVLLLRAPYFARPSGDAANGSPNRTLLAYAGVLFCAAGITFAIWARSHLGRNWSPTPSLKAEHELITSGPYRLVRHPIYTGILLALLGNTLVFGARWLIFVLVFVAIVARRVTHEERLMMQQFPEQYPEYRKRTKAIIPFVV